MFAANVFRVLLNLHILAAINITILITTTMMYNAQVLNVFCHFFVLALMDDLKRHAEGT